MPNEEESLETTSEQRVADANDLVLDSGEQNENGSPIGVNVRANKIIILRNDDQINITKYPPEIKVPFEKNVWEALYREENLNRLFK